MRKPSISHTQGHTQPTRYYDSNLQLTLVESTFSNELNTS